MLTVAATDLNGLSSYFSNANAAVDLSAPGERIGTAVPRAFDPDRDGNGYALLDGTSFAAPIVAGAGAWVAAERPGLSADQLAQVIRLSARDLDREGWDPHTGFGLLDVGAALRRRAPRNDPHEPNENIFWVNGRIFANRDPVVYDGRPRRTGLARAARPVRGPRGRLPGEPPGRGRAPGSRSCRPTATSTLPSSAAARATRPSPPRAVAAHGPLARVGRDPKPRQVGPPRVRRDLHRPVRERPGRGLLAQASAWPLSGEPSFIAFTYTSSSDVAP